MMRKLLLFASALLCAASMWADAVEGPWTQIERRAHSCANTVSPSITYNGMDNYPSWSGTISPMSGENGIGYVFAGTSEKETKMGIFSIYGCSVDVPAYALVEYRWRYTVCSQTVGHHSTTCLYMLPDITQLKNLAVDFSNHYDSQTGADKLLTRLTRKDQDGDKAYSPIRNAGIQTLTFQFDNRASGEQQTKSWYLMLTHVMASGETGKAGLNEWGTFKSLTVDTTWIYRKIVSFNANGGAGEMADQTIENSGTLTANAFTRDNHTFAGWATSANGPVVYAEAAEITANEYSKGPVTLYAVWTPVNYSISYELNEGSVETPNPTSYNPETATFTLANPTKADYTFLGWNGSNGEVPQTAVSIAKGSTGNKSFTAHWMSNAVGTTQDLIAAIGEVTTESGEAIAAARDAYNALSGEDQALVANYTTLTAAEAAYEAAKDAAGNTTINFKHGEASLGSQKIELDYPAAPPVEGYTFQYWQVVAEDVTAGTIRLQAVYKSNTPTGLDETIVNGQSSNRKFIKEGNLYILKDEFIYTINGQKVK